MANGVALTAIPCGISPSLSTRSSSAGDPCFAAPNALADRATPSRAVAPGVAERSAAAVMRHGKLAERLNPTRRGIKFRRTATAAMKSTSGIRRRPLFGVASRWWFARRVLQLERDAGHECHPTREELRVGYHCMAEHDQWLHVNGNCWHADMPSAQQVADLLLQFPNLASVRVPLRGDVALGPGDVRMVLDAVVGLGALRSCHVQADVAGWVEREKRCGQRDDEAEEEDKKGIARERERRWAEEDGWLGGGFPDLFLGLESRLQKLTLLHTPGGSGDGDRSAWRLSQLQELETPLRVPFDDDYEEYEKGRGVWSHYLGLTEEGEGDRFSFPNLREMILTKCWGGAMEIDMGPLPSLTHLSVFWSVRLHGIDQGWYSNLRFLHLYQPLPDCHWEGKPEGELGSRNFFSLLPKLHTLVVDNCCQVGGREMLASLSALTQLHTLRLSMIRNDMWTLTSRTEVPWWAWDHGLEAYYRNTQVSHLKPVIACPASLRVLQITKCDLPFLPDSLASATALTELTLHHWTSLQTLPSFLASFTELRRIRVTVCGENKPSAPPGLLPLLKDRNWLHAVDCDGCRDLHKREPCRE
ncbi:unnamed protein product [Closterium sp. Yama58-4]|nr:unnamed protein product [Closterium sp. Yama58-4]